MNPLIRSLTFLFGPDRCGSVQKIDCDPKQRDGAQGTTLAILVQTLGTKHVETAKTGAKTETSEVVGTPIACSLCSKWSRLPHKEYSLWA